MANREKSELRRKDDVTGSNPSSSIKKNARSNLRSFFCFYLGLTKEKERAPKNNFARQKNFREEEQVDCENYRLLGQTVEKSELRRKDEVIG